MKSFLYWLAFGLALVALDFTLGYLFPWWKAFSLLAKVLFFLPTAASVGLLVIRKL